MSADRTPLPVRVRVRYRAAVEVCPPAVEEGVRTVSAAISPAETVRSLALTPTDAGPVGSAPRATGPVKKPFGTEQPITIRLPERT